MNKNIIYGTIAAAGLSVFGAHLRSDSIQQERQAEQNKKIVKTLDNAIQIACRHEAKEFSIFDQAEGELYKYIAQSGKDYWERQKDQTYLKMNAQVESLRTVFSGYYSDRWKLMDAKDSIVSSMNKN